MPDELQDPRQAFLDAGYVPVPETPVTVADHHYAEIAMGIAAGFIAYRALASRWLAEQQPPSSEGAFHELIVKLASNSFWTKFLLPAVERAYELGRIGTPVELSDNVKLVMAQNFVESLGSYVNDTSAEALMEGYNASMSAGWSERVAWERAAAGYGLDRNQMRQWIMPQIKTPAAYQQDFVNAAARKAVDKLLMIRAERLGVNEAFHAVQVSKTLYWLYLQQTGDLPPEAQKKWFTANDERVCPLCAPLDGVSVPLNEQFVVGDQKMWAPGAHPKCRCEVAITYVVSDTVPDDASELGALQKNMPGDPYNREPDGHFSRREERRAMPQRAFAYQPEPEVAVEEQAANLRGEPEVNLRGPVVNLRGGEPTVSLRGPTPQLRGPEANLRGPIVNLRGGDPAQGETLRSGPVTKKRIIHRIIIVKGVATNVTEEVDDKPPVEKTSVVYVNGDHFADMRDRSYTQDGSMMPNLVFKPGHTVDFDMMFDHPDASGNVRSIKSMVGYEHAPTGGGNAFDYLLTEDIPTYRMYQRNSYRSSAQSSGEQAFVNIDNDAEEILYDVEGTFDSMGYGRKELTALADEAVRNGFDGSKIGFLANTGSGADPFSDMKTSQISALLAKEIAADRYAGPLAQAAYNRIKRWAAGGHGHEIGEFELDSTIGVQIDDIPTIIKVEGWKGGYIDRPSIHHALDVILEGAYVVVDVQPKVPVPANVNSRLLSDGQDPLDFKYYRMVTIRPRKD